jgi:MarR family transcriptional regulator, organic hydroperoxide resistance regulator
MPRRLAIGNDRDLVQAEQDIRKQIGDYPLDFAAMAAVSNIYRAANAIRNHMERDVLASEDLSWAAFTVLFVLWIWGDQQTRHLAAEAGVTKGTLTGVLKTLEKRDLAQRRGHDEDGRLVMVTLRPHGRSVIERLFPAFNAGETHVSSALTPDEKEQLAFLLRKIIRSVEPVLSRCWYLVYYRPISRSSRSSSVSRRISRRAWPARTATTGGRPTRL